VWTYGKIEIQFQYLKEQPPFDDLELRLELRRRLNEIPGVSIPDNAITRRPSVPLAIFADPESLAALKDALDWVCAMARSDRAGRAQD
jgi:hypothetical protein